MEEPARESGVIPAFDSRMIDQQIGEIVRRLVGALSPQAIYLFGSHAYGTPTEASDVDIMVVLPGPVPPVSVCYGRGHASLRGLLVPVELHFASAAGFHRRRNVTGSLEHEIARRGRLLYAT
jgi:predicted nucleotidyltransferase